MEIVLVNFRDEEEIYDEYTEEDEELFLPTPKASDNFFITLTDKGYLPIIKKREYYKLLKVDGFNKLVIPVLKQKTPKEIEEEKKERVKDLERFYTKVVATMREQHNLEAYDEDSEDKLRERQDVVKMANGELTMEEFKSRHNIEKRGENV